VNYATDTQKGNANISFEVVILPQLPSQASFLVQLCDVVSEKIIINK
jgi:hypothetical protein